MLKQKYRNDITAIIPFYNDAAGGIRLHEYLKLHKIKSIWADGRYHNFKQIDGHDLSIDGLRNYLLAQKDVTLINTGLCYMHDKLNDLFGNVDTEYCIIFGCDEYPVGDFDILMQNLHSYNTGEPQYYRIEIDEKVQNNTSYEKEGIERIFYKPLRFVAKHAHWCFYVERKLMTSLENIVKGITVVHDDTVRTPKRNQLMFDYQVINKKIERDKFSDMIRLQIIKERNERKRMV